MGIDTVVLVTGSSQGIGRAIAEGFAGKQWQVILNSRSDNEKIHSVRDTIVKAGGKAEIATGDVSKEEDVNTIVKNIFDQWGRIDVLINNAGLIHEDLISSVSDEKWDRILDANVKGVFLCTKAVSRYMVKAQSGSIINISSIQGVRGGNGTSAYAASKGGVISFTKSAARELGKRGITVNAVLPGYQATGMENKSYENRAKEMSVLGTTTAMQELVEFVIFLSQVNSVSGQVFNWDSRII